MPSLLPSGSPELEASALPPRRILFLDAYDSFTNNIVSLLKDALGADVVVHVLHMDLKTLHSDPRPDWTEAQFLARLRDFDAVVCGPGPGSPLCDADVGAFKLLWGLPRDKAVPVLGICLGFQSLVEHFGGGIRKLRRGLHGMVRPIEHRGSKSASPSSSSTSSTSSSSLSDIFRGVPPFRATLYHSLCADIGQDDVPADRWHEQRWAAPGAAPDLLPLAWTVERSELGEERILMGVRHASLPFWGVQYHPESVCTDPEASGVLRNWFAQALKWNETMGRVVRQGPEHTYPDSLDARTLLDQGLAAQGRLGTQRWWREMQFGLAAEDAGAAYYARRITLPDGVDAADVAEVFGLGGRDSILLDSSSTVTGDPLARNSVIALGVDEALRIEYRVGDGFVSLRLPATPSRPEQQQFIPVDDGPDNGPLQVWDVVSEYWRRRQLSSRHSSSSASADPAFNGGFLGFVTFEMGLDALSPGSVSRDRGHDRPDLCFAWVSKSIVLDHQAGLAYVQMLSHTREAAQSWIDATIQRLQSSEAWLRPGYQVEKYSSAPASKGPKGKGGDRDLRFEIPDPQRYEADVRRCQDAISEGQSYELCLTGQTTMTRPVGDDTPHHLRAPGSCSANSGKSFWQHHGTPWQIFRTLRARQPAPFGSFIQLAGATVISSSPERFLSSTPAGACSMRPMKGTVRKSPAVATLAQAEALLHVPKEEAENLMIVDLVRHDLHGVCGVGAVAVPDLLKVEEYASVFQMITVVNGQLPDTDGYDAGVSEDGDEGDVDGVNGLNVLAAALPPGSMTGAPKKRSCEILGAIETVERSIYSGVVGYFDVKGQGDWSVTIRTMFRWDDEREVERERERDGEVNGQDDKESEGWEEEGEEEGCREREVWRVGAGGAVTILSTPEGEREEMRTKLAGPLGIFRDVA
ncbi:Aminodeoxychorismate synthase [Escovopsis weberi]|uniref:aminodeoxychorismate synthase n=1 Tax=Escovopsis weberi TaxID=150374 RepID=A0A0M9VVV4_ESCWE|nr:Aminodeoxychorismate synthase [Escovopsis weberi]